MTWAALRFNSQRAAFANHSYKHACGVRMHCRSLLKCCMVQISKQEHQHQMLLENNDLASIRLQCNCLQTPHALGAKPQVSLVQLLLVVLILCYICACLHAFKLAVAIVRQGKLQRLPW